MKTSLVSSCSACGTGTGDIQYPVPSYFSFVLAATLIKMSDNDSDNEEGIIEEENDGDNDDVGVRITRWALFIIRLMKVAGMRLERGTAGE